MPDPWVHPSPPIHAIYNKYNVLVRIGSLTIFLIIIKGDLPNRAEKPGGVQGGGERSQGFGVTVPQEG